MLAKALFLADGSSPYLQDKHLRGCKIHNVRRFTKGSDSKSKKEA